MLEHISIILVIQIKRCLHRNCAALLSVSVVTSKRPCVISSSSFYMDERNTVGRPRLNYERWGIGGTMQGIEYKK
jgi:hypothetical protein